jgi:hypothetical protein
MTCDKSTTTETAARWAMQHQMKLQRGGSYGREVFKGIYAAEQSEGKRISVSPDGLQRDRFASCTANRARARPTCIVTKCRKRYLSRSRETVRLSWTASASRCRKEPLSESARRFGGRWETTQNQTLSLWFWAPSRRRTFPWAEGPFWATGFPIEERYRVGRKRERNRPCRVLSRKMCRFGGTSGLRILGKRNIVSPIQSDRSHPRRL